MAEYDYCYVESTDPDLLIKQIQEREQEGWQLVNVAGWQTYLPMSQGPALLLIAFLRKEK